MPTFLERARELDPIPYSDDMSSEIARNNEFYNSRVDSLLLQLRHKDYKNVEEAAALHDFYMYSLGMMECDYMTFPNTKLVNKLTKLYPLLPRSYRVRVTMQDLTPGEIDKAMRRVAKRMDLGDAPFAKEVKRKPLRV